MLRLLELNKEFKIVEANSFIANHGGQNKLFPNFVNSLSGLKLGSFHFDIDILKQPFKEFSRLFSQIFG